MIKGEIDSKAFSERTIKCFSDVLISFTDQTDMFSIALVKTRIHRKKHIRYTVEYASTPEKAAYIGRKLFQPYYDREYLYAIAFSSKMEPLAANLVSIGGLSATMVDPGRIFAFAILSAANSIMLFHNHVSGFPSPSREDVNVPGALRNVVISWGFNWLIIS